jgi:hypothetical protein
MHTAASLLKKGPLSQDFRKFLQIGFPGKHLHFFNPVGVFGLGNNAQGDFRVFLPKRPQAA